MIGFLTPFADDGISLAFGFVFMGTNLAAAALVYFFLLESVGLSLEAVDKMYGVEGLKVRIFCHHRFGRITVCLLSDYKALEVCVICSTRIH